MGCSLSTEVVVTSPPRASGGQLRQVDTPTPGAEDVSVYGDSSHKIAHYLPSEPNGKRGESAALPVPAENADEIVISGTEQNLEGSKIFRRSSSVLGKFIEDRDADGDLTSRVVHIELPGGRPIENVYDGVHDGPELGRGVTGIAVRLVRHRSTGVEYAVKTLDVTKVKTEEGLQQLREEIHAMSRLDHPDIVRLEEVYECPGTIYLVQELCTGGELFDALDELPGYRYSEERAACLVSQIVSAVQYMHGKGIVHRDLKLENFLFEDGSPDAELKMIDFGLSKHFRRSGEAHHEAVGTPYTVAPEVIGGSYDERCDLWAIGVIAFVLLCGDTPFGGCGDSKTDAQIADNIQRADYTFEASEVWDGVSGEAKDFIRNLLVLDPRQRWTAEEAQKSPWLRRWIRKRSGRRREISDLSDLNVGVVDALVEFRDYTGLRKLLCEVLSFTLLPDQIGPMRREFRKLDSDGAGEISLDEFKHAISRRDGDGAAGKGGATPCDRRVLTDDEVQGVFDAMRQHEDCAKAVEEEEQTAPLPRVHWHEFVAAGLSQCRVDERNFKLAFDRLDAGHKGYIAFDDILDLSGHGSDDEDEMRRQWGELMNQSGNAGGCITYEDFLLLMRYAPCRRRSLGHPSQGALSPPASIAVKS